MQSIGPVASRVADRHVPEMLHLQSGFSGYINSPAESKAIEIKRCHYRRRHDASCFDLSTVLVHFQSS